MHIAAGWRQLREPRLFRISDNAYGTYCHRLQKTGLRLGDIEPVNYVAWMVGPTVFLEA